MLQDFFTIINPQARSQPARWGGGSELGWVEHQAHPPPLGHCPRDVIRPPKNWKTPPSWTFTSTPPPPLGHCPCDVIHIFQGWNKIAKGWNKIAKGWNKIFGMGNWGGPSDPPPPPTPPPPPGYGPDPGAPATAQMKIMENLASLMTRVENMMPKSAVVCIIST